MAAEAVVGAALGALLNVLVDRMTSGRFVAFTRRHSRSDGLLQKLKFYVTAIEGVLDDAEEQEITRLTVKEWLYELKNAFFEADDLIDEIDYEATRLELEAEFRSLIDKVRRFLRPRKSFKKGLKARLTDIVEKFEVLMNQMHGLSLKENRGSGESTQRDLTTSYCETPDSFGREGDLEAIMKVLLSDDVNRRSNLGIISIVGLGGMGKTTLATLIYNDERVQKRFDVTAFVRVSEVFDVWKITRDIAMQVPEVACGDKTLNQIQVGLKEKLTGKKLLLVLDDVWNENPDHWEKLLTPLTSAGPRSTIIVTTRNDDVVKTVGSSSIFPLSKLDFNDCWQLFCKCAFDDQNDYPPRLKEIGREIVKRCDGLPLAVKVMGGLLRISGHVRAWENVLRNDLWEVSNNCIFPVLRLSYRYLPSHIKQCFAYCSIFPKNYRFNKKQLILLWMAEGFLIKQKGKETMEEVGEEYFEELVSRSFFQHINNSFVMHDLINDLARVVAGDFCFRFENQDFRRAFNKLRHLSCLAVKEESSSQQLSRIFKSCHLRTFLPLYNTLSWEKQGQMLQEMIPDLFPNQQRLRVLSLSRCQNLVGLPNSFSHLKQHLRYLDLSFTSIESLPECLYSFYNLQTLILSWCQKLAKLPTKMGRMISMHHLDIEGTKLQEMPPNMGKLKKLQTLTDFFVGKREGCTVKELGSLQQLGGTLRIHNLQHVVNAQDAFESKIRCKKNLKKLYLYWEGDTDDPHREEDVLNGLQPHTEIEVISIVGYGGTNFPNWLGEFSFTNLVSLELEECRYCSSLPPIGQMSNLKYLKVRGFNEVRVVYSDFYGRCVSAVKPFQSLEIIRFEDMPQWQEWTPYGGGESESGAFPCLKELSVINCPNLKGALPIHLPSLTKLVIGNSPQLQNCIPNAPNLSSLVLRNCSTLQLVQRLPSTLTHLNRRFYDLTSLRELCIEDCPEIVSLPVPPNLISLSLNNLQNLRSLEGVRPLTSFESLRILNCPHLKTLPKEGLPSSVSYVKIWGGPLLLIIICIQSMLIFFMFFF